MPNLKFDDDEEDVANVECCTDIIEDLIESLPPLSVSLLGAKNVAQISQKPSAFDDFNCNGDSNSATESLLNMIDIGLVSGSQSNHDSDDADDGDELTELEAEKKKSQETPNTNRYGNEASTTTTTTNTKMTTTSQEAVMEMNKERVTTLASSGISSASDVSVIWCL